MTEVRATSSRRIALDVLLRVEDGAFAHILLPRTLRDSALEPRDRALVTDLVYGTVRMQRALDELLSRVSNRGIASLDPPVRAALRLGAYQLLIGVPAHAAVGETVEVVDPRARGFANGVLRDWRAPVHPFRSRRAATWPRWRYGRRTPTGSSACSSSRSAPRRLWPPSTSTTCRRP